jgi:predicted amidohydrolase YtcJ
MIESPDRLLIRNVRLGPRGPRRDLRIADGRVVEIVEDGGPRPGERIADAEGGTALPGLWDAHVHIVQWSAARRRLDLSTSRSARDAVRLVTEYAARTGTTGRPTPVEITAPGGGVAGSAVLEGYGFRDALWPDVPHKSMLEAAMPGRAVVLMSNDLHLAWFSPAALALVGRGDHPTGVVLEKEAYEAVAALPPAAAGLVDRWVAEATTAAAARGVVGVLDFEYADNVADWGRRVRERRIDVRVVCSVPGDRLEEAVGRGLRTGQPLPGAGLEMGPVKLFVDGSLNTRTAYCAEPYPGGERGRLEMPPDELRATMERAAANGLHPAVHAIGDLAVDIALAAFEAVGCPGRIEHAQLVRAQDFARFARQGLVAGVQPAHAPDDREVADVQWKGRTGRAFAYADLLAAGATLEIGSDAPVAPLNPWDGIAAAVFRTDDERPPWHPEQAIALESALAAASRGRRGIRPGDPADLVIVERDPAELTASELRNIQVWGTMLAGRWTHRA